MYLKHEIKNQNKHISALIQTTQDERRRKESHGCNAYNGGVCLIDAFRHCIHVIALKQNEQIMAL